MWTTQYEDLPSDRGIMLSFTSDGRRASFGDVFQGWRRDAEFRAMFNGVLANAPFAAFRWETPPITADTLSRPFECVLRDDRSLQRPSAPEAFAEHFARDSQEVVSFRNLGGDAILVAPRPEGDPSAYGHLAAFVRLAPEHQRHALWQAVGEAMERRVGAKPVWLSTAGAGVPWLHVRLDDEPKYYGFMPYTEALSYIRGKWVGPWFGVENAAERQALLAQLQRELPAGHVLSGVPVTLVGRRQDCDDVLYELEDGRVAAVHLTWVSEPGPLPDFPWTDLFDSFDRFVEEEAAEDWPMH